MSTPAPSTAAHPTAAERLGAARRLVLKIGSALLVDDAVGEVKHDWLQGLAADVARCRARGQEVLIVSSGAIAVGRRDLGLSDGALQLDEKQAAAATGQIKLAHAYSDALARHGLRCAQILLSPTDTEERRRHLNARATLSALLRLGAVPVINENDTVTTEEIRFGDNDRLAARVAQMISADLLVLLSDIDGLYAADPRRDPDAAFIDEVPKITAQVEAMAGEPPPGYSSGGMKTKIAAAKIAVGAGCSMAIMDGRMPGPLAAMEAGGRCTWFLAHASPPVARKRWIAGALTPVGALTVDDGAAAALRRGSSLLPVGIVDVQGQFERGDPVLVKSAEGAVLGRGLAAYSSADARHIKGRKTADIEPILGYRGRDEMIHRDDLVLDRAHGDDH